jgi:coenzyme F420-reducing hydrogenase beta subunit
MSLADAAHLSRAEIVSSGLCIGCGGCVTGEAVPGRSMAWNGRGQLQPHGPREWLHQADARFAATCPFSPHARDEDQITAALFPEAPQADPHIGRYAATYVGHVQEDGFRPAGSSGGLVTWVAAELLRRGLVDGVAHVAAADPEADGRLFGYRLSRTQEEVRAGAKSRYYPIELSQVLDEIRTVPGRYAVVGIPCFIKAVHLARAQDPVLAERIPHTLGLFCGHMKSARMVDSFALQMGAAPEAVRAVDYRLKNPDRPANWYRTQLRLADGGAPEQDWWHLLEGDWGSGFFQSNACNFCDDVVAETADISFGDAWVEPYSSDGRGTNVVVVRSPAVHALVEEAIAARRLALAPVDAAFVVETQAAGFRQRREGLAYRLALRKRGIMPRKRVAPSRSGLPLRRRAIYRMRAWITASSHALFALSRVTGNRAIYERPTQLLLAMYQALAYSRGRLGALVDRLERMARAARAEPPNQ